MGRSNKRESNKSTRNRFTGFQKNYSSKNNWSYPRPKVMHKAKCSDCGKDCEVPFKPTEGKPVYCRECYRSKKKW